MFIDKLKQSPVIAGIRNLNDVSLALEKKVNVLFIIKGDIFDLIKVKEQLSSLDVLLFAHMELIEGVARDKAGVSFLGRKIGIDGILTTHANLIKFARKEGLIAVQRLFVLDSEALKTGIEVMQSCKPDAVEILPGIILPNLKEDIKNLNFPPIIAGGLIRTCEDVKKILEAGALAVSTSKKELWGRF